MRSSPVNAVSDPTLLFTNAGMNQFKSIFMGKNPNQLKRVYNTQKCIRVSGKHNDLEEVGKDTYHHTFFEMLGNWSFNDYYKSQAIEWAWELLTQVWNIPAERLFVSIHDSDKEALQLWSKFITPDRILKFGDKENFWEMGEIGPCGPCSEIHYDKGNLNTQKDTYLDPIQGVNGENDRYIEIWNLVFIQSQRMKSGELLPLTQKHIDTGMGFERICAVLQNKNSNYDTDIFIPLIQKISHITNTTYQKNSKGTPHRVIADHIRTLTFSIADGVMPSNEGQGYVIRRILRRASRYGRLLGQKKAFLYRLVPLLCEQMDTFPELAERQKFIISVIQNEEERFIKTLDQGLDRFNKLASQLQIQQQNTITGKEAFMLYDTYGFPLDLTCLLAQEKNLQVDTQGYQQYMNEQHEKAKAAKKFTTELESNLEWIHLKAVDQTPFIGYHKNTQTNAQIVSYALGKYLYIILENTVFYPEGGGQVGDRGLFTFTDNSKQTIECSVIDTFKQDDTIIHKCNLPKDTHSLLKSLQNTPIIQTKINQELRQYTTCHHSSTHLLQSGLIKVLGDHIQQQGSKVNEHCLRFDFTHFKSVSASELKQIEEWVNHQIQQNHLVTDIQCSFEDAKKQQAIALFSEKYGDSVRVINIGSNNPISKELCGGTHVKSTGDIQQFKIIKESSIASGIRRIEAVSNNCVNIYLHNKLSQEQQELNTHYSKFDTLQKSIQNKPHLKELQIQVKELNQNWNNLQTTAQNIQEKNTISSLEIWLEQTQYWVSQLENNLKNWEQVQAQELEKEAKSYLQELNTQHPYGILFKTFQTSSKTFKTLAEKLQSLLNNTVCILINHDQNSISMSVWVSSNLTSQIQANSIIKQLSHSIPEIKGGGGKDKAQAGCKNRERFNDIQKEIQALIGKGF